MPHGPAIPAAGGLGLSIVKHVVANHGGEVTRWPQPGQGSTFTIRLPELEGQDPDAVPGRATRRPVRHEAAARLRPRTQDPYDMTPQAPMSKELPLEQDSVVEDEESFSNPLSYLLGKEGFEVEVVDNGIDAIIEFDRNGADLVLLDLQLPGQSGTEVCRQLRQRSVRPGHHADGEGRGDRQGRGSGTRPDDYVTKPYSSREWWPVSGRCCAARANPRSWCPARSRQARSGWTLSGMSSRSSGEQVSLPLKEFELLEMLLRNSGPGPDPGAAD